MTEYIVDFALQGKNGTEFQACWPILADNSDMANVIFEDALSQSYPDATLVDVGTYESSKDQ